MSKAMKRWTIVRTWTWAPTEWAACGWQYIGKGQDSTGPYYCWKRLRT